MKSAKILVIISFLTTGMVRAQDVAFGPKAGLNLSEIKIDDPQASYDARTGYHVGVFIRSKFSKVAVQPEILLYTQKGEFSGVGYDGKEDFTYITVPIMIKFYPVLGLNLQLGPQFGILLDGERQTNGFLGTTKQDIRDQYDGNDFAVSAGAGWDFKFGLSLDARYNIGVKDINNAGNGEEAKTRVFLVSVGWNFMK